MKNNFTNFNGLYLQDQDYLSPDFIFSELIEARSSLFDWKVNSHLHTKLYQFFFIIKGKGVCLLPNSDQKFNDHTILIIPPSYLHGFDWQPNSFGHILTVSSRLVETLLKYSPLVLAKFSQPNIITELNNNLNFDNCINLINNINIELANQNTERFPMLKFQFGQLLLNIFRSCPKIDTFVPKGNHTTLNIFNNFQKNIQKSGFTQKTIMDYAKEINVTSVQLNKICKDIADKPAISIINEHFISEIKLNLIHTTLSISDICYQLNFNAPAYFTRFFKKHTGLSPKEYRKLINTKN
ncbi:MAG: helix-turn-helix domain-containing protein [bacterium]